MSKSAAVENPIVADVQLLKPTTLRLDAVIPSLVVGLSAISPAFNTAIFIFAVVLLILLQLTQYWSTSWRAKVAFQTVRNSCTYKPCLVAMLCSVTRIINAYHHPNFHCLGPTG